MNSSICNSLFADHSTNGSILSWVRQRNREVKVEVREVPFRRLKDWHFDPTTGNLQHDSGGFFSVVGLDVFVDNGHEQRWQQPIINQPEIGYLAILAKEFDGVLHFLLQAKIEPGNVNCVQLSPTLHATRSNYTQRHHGRKPLFLEKFQNVDFRDVILDQLQSEQGARVLRKRNRNRIMLTHDDIP